MAAGPDIRCADCGTPLLPTGRQPAREWYMLHDHVWAQTGMPPTGGHYLCLGCVEARIGRPLTGADLTSEQPINDPSDADAPRMHALKLDRLALASVE